MTPSPSSEPAATNGGYPNRQALVRFALFRLCVALGLLVVFVPSPDRLWLASSPFPLTVSVTLIYALLVLVGTLAPFGKRPSRENQVQVAVFVDVVALTLLMHADASSRTGLGLLLATSVAAGALLMGGRRSLLFASFATLGVITQQLYAQLYLHSGAGSLTQAGLLGITFFTVALLGHVLYRRIQETERLAARRQIDIDDLSQLNEFIIQRMGTGVLVVDRSQRLRLMNGASIQLLGLPLSVQGQRLQDIAPQLATWLDTQVSSPTAAGETDSVVVGDHEVRPNCMPLGEGAGAGTLVFLRDNRELAREAHQIKLAALGRLTASIAHNIRNPLSSISHAGQLLAEAPNLRAEDRHLLDIVRRNSRRINDIIESVLQVSRRNPASPKRIELGSWLTGFCTELRETRELSEDKLRLVAPSTSLTVDVDPRHLHQIMSNLCDNALKHGGSGQAPVRVEIEALSDPIRGYPMIEVRDNGPGIDPTTADEIFNPFYSTSPSGTGLGLYIAKELSETNGAELQYIAPESRGARFRLSFPKGL